MDYKKTIMKYIVHKLDNIKSSLLIPIVMCVYALIGCYMYLGEATFSCRESLASPPGDQAAGLIGYHTLDSTTPWWGYTSKVNAPYGEVLGNPVHITSQVTFIPFWMLSKIAGPVCGYNILSTLGFVFSATVMFLFISRFFNRRALAFLAGFAFVFTPYLTIKTGVHISYVFVGIFVLIVWQFLRFLKDPTKQKAIILGVITGLLLYIDVYFVYIGAVLYLGLFLSALYVGYRDNLIHHKQIKRYHVVWAFLVTLLLMAAPIIYIKITNSATIDSLVSSSRNNFMHEAQVYGARPKEYILPNPMQPELAAVFGEKFTKRDFHNSNEGESVLSLSLTMIAISVAGAVVLFKTRHKKQLRPIRHLYVSALIITVIAFLFSLPPIIKGVPTPTYVVASMVTIWRVFARLQILVNMGLVLMTSISLLVMLQKRKHRYYLLSVGVLFLLILIEYRTFSFMKPAWHYSSVPGAYHWISTRPDIRRIVIYPLDEQSRSIYPTYYASYQRVHSKEMLNSLMANSPQAGLRNGLRDLDAPQTAQTLRGLGIDTIIVNAVNDPALPTNDYRLIYVGEGINEGLTGSNKAYVYSILEGERSRVSLAIDPRSSALISRSPTDINYSFIGKGIIYPVNLVNTTLCKQVNIDFRISSNDSGAVLINQGSKTLYNVATPYDGKIELAIDSSGPVILESEIVKNKFNIRDLGVKCLK